MSHAEQHPGGIQIARARRVHHARKRLRRDLHLFAAGDQQSVNPGTSLLLRSGNLLDRAIYYRHDLAYALDPLHIPKNPHTFAGTVVFPNSALYQSIGRWAQDLIGAFLASDGTVIIHPEPGSFFEVPIASPLPEELNFVR